MARYQDIALQLGEAIERLVYRPGERLPSVRRASRAHGVAVGTMLRVYEALESQGLIEARPRSGYFARPCQHVAYAEPGRSQPVSRRAPVDISQLVFQLLDETRLHDLVPFGSAFPSPELFPFTALMRSAAAAARRLDPWSSVHDLPPGNGELRRWIARRYRLSGCSVDPEEIVITNGALEAINLCLQAVTRPGDTVAVESPTFYATLQAIERLRLRAIEIPTHPRTGLDVPALARALRRTPVRACIAMSNFQNPLGSLMTDADKQALVELLKRHQVPLIEDDVYAELYHGEDRPRPAKRYDRDGGVLHCGSFAKCLAPGLRVGWAAPGRFRERVQQLKVMTSIATPSLTQAALVNYLRDHSFDRHLRALRAKLTWQLQLLLRSMETAFPSDCRITRPQGGYLLWLQLPPNVDALRLHALAERDRIGVAPGPLFSARRSFRQFVRLNFGHPWSARSARAIDRLGELMRLLQSRGAAGMKR
ncbi:MAG TPA: PLP-dependent aminotransferase family protein [Steroidobacteraceae bacterium]|jgi:DNA-binding transcriptional MocR family regulator|nr:PLP-dependent aminotransferase family protein [Steroidobacteraceae bacterium]